MITLSNSTQQDDPDIKSNVISILKANETELNRALPNGYKMNFGQLSTTNMITTTSILDIRKSVKDLFSWRS